MSKTENKWTLSKGVWIRPTKTPGVWECKEGGFLIRGTATDPLNGVRKDVRRVLRDVRTEYEAKHILEEELARIRTVATPDRPTERLKFDEYCERYLTTKISLGKIRSAATKELWRGFVKNWFQHAAWFDYYLDATTSQHIKLWRDTKLAPLVQRGEASPVTMNGMLSKLRQVWNKAFEENLVSRSPMLGVEDFDTSTVRTYSHDQPNSLTDGEIPLFLAKFRQMFRKHYCQVVIGFITGQRPSSLRPLRRKGPESDLLWEQKAIVIRRSHTRKQVIMDKSKTRKNYQQADPVLALPDEIWKVIEEHIDGYETDEQVESDLLFPTRDGQLQSPSALQKPFAKVCKALKLKKDITPRAMRRTSGDLARSGNVDIAARMAISGHKTEAMKTHYETVAAEEMRRTLKRVYEIATGTGRAPQEPEPTSGGRPTLRRVK